jgi:hypothetical protein
MKNVLPFITLFFICSSSIAQSDSTIIYFSKEEKEITKDSAFSYVTFMKKDNLWHGRGFYVKNSSLKSDGYYADKNFSKPVGSLKNYKEDGSLHFTTEYNNGEPVEKTFYYKNGNKKSWISYKGEQNEEKGWDEKGKEILGFVVEREARFKGGSEGWRRFLEKHLNANVAASSGAPVGQYQVKVQFIVSKEGYVSNVKAVEIPKACKPCATEVVSVLLNGPQWEPAIQDNEPVKYQAIQYVTFLVEEGNKKQKRG